MRKYLRDWYLGFEPLRLEHLLYMSIQTTTPVFMSALVLQTTFLQRVNLLGCCRMLRSKKWVCLWLRTMDAYWLCTTNCQPSLPKYGSTVIGVFRNHTSWPCSSNYTMPILGQGQQVCLPISLCCIYPARILHS